MSKRYGEEKFHTIKDVPDLKTEKKKDSRDHSPVSPMIIDCPYIMLDAASLLLLG